MIFRQTNKDNIFLNKMIYDIDFVNADLHTIIEDDWINQVNSKPKLRTYKLFKTSFEVSDYVKLSTIGMKDPS